jgi:cation diffusion facilitator CzcD-associated flavoprotein CzcO
MKKDAQYFETMIIGTGFSGLLAAIRLRRNNLKEPEIDCLAIWRVLGIL